MIGARIAIVGAATTALALAQFGMVFDPTVNSNILVTIEKAIRQNAITLATLEQLQSIYATASNAARPVAARDAWRYPLSSVLYPGAGNIYGTSGAWITGINSGLATSIGYENATPRAANPGAIFNNLSALGQQNFASQYATLELTDGLAQHAMAVTGAYRGAQEDRAAALAKLQNDTLSVDPDQNTEVGVLNKVNSATLMHAQAQQDTNSLLAAIADQQTVAAKARRDALVDELNAVSAIHAANDLTLNNLTGGDAEAHKARIP